MSVAGRNLDSLQDVPRRPRRVLERLRDGQNANTGRIEALERGRNTVSTERAPGTTQYANTLGYAIPAGTLLTFISGQLALADADAIATRAYFATKSMARAGAWFDGVRIDGAILLRTVGAANIVAGDGIFLSATAGVVTHTMPSSANQIVQLVGTAIAAEGAQTLGMVLVNMVIEPGRAVRIL